MFYEPFYQAKILERKVEINCDHGKLYKDIVHCDNR